MYKKHVVYFYWNHVKNFPPNMPHIPLNKTCAQQVVAHMLLHFEKIMHIESNMSCIFAQSDENRILDLVFLLSLHEDLEKLAWGHLLVNFVLMSEIVCSIPELLVLEVMPIHYWIPWGCQILTYAISSLLIPKDLRTCAISSSYDSIFCLLP